MENDRFKLEKFPGSPGWWFLTDKKSGVKIDFKEHEFNETQQVSVLSETGFALSARAAGMDVASFGAKVMSEMADYMYTHHYSVAFPTPKYELQLTEDNNTLMIYHHDSPRFIVSVCEDAIDMRELGDAMRLCGKFMKKTYRRGEIYVNKKLQDLI